MEDDKPNDAMVEAQIERTLAEYHDRLPPEALARCREVLRDVLTAHPVASRWMKKLRRPPLVVSSGIVATDGRDGTAQTRVAKARGGGSR